MCKLFGWIGENEKKYDNDVVRNVVRILKSLILAESYSNPHGLGIFIKTKNKEYLKKWANPFHAFLETYHYLDIMVSRELIFIMGHLRYATTGVVSKEMAHPYKFSHIVGAHNGVLTIRPEKQEESDSKSFFRKVNRRLKKGESLPAVLQKMLKREIGDFAFTLYVKGQLFFIRRRRPLSFFKTPFGLFWASTEEMWNKALKIAELNIVEEKIILKENVLYQIKLDEMKLEEVCKIDEPPPPTWWEWDYSYPRYSSSTRKFKNRDWYLYSEYDYWPEDDYWPAYYYNYYDNEEDEKDKEIIKKRLLKKS